MPTTYCSAPLEYVKRSIFVNEGADHKAQTSAQNEAKHNWYGCGRGHVRAHDTLKWPRYWTCWCIDMTVQISANIIP